MWKSRSHMRALSMMYSANLRRAGSVEIHHLTPRVALPGQVGPEARR